MTRFDRAAAIVLFALFAICTTIAVVANVPVLALFGLCFLIGATLFAGMGGLTR